MHLWERRALRAQDRTGGPTLKQAWQARLFLEVFDDGFGSRMHVELGVDALQVLPHRIWSIPELSLPTPILPS